ncbi:hypothetical protein ABH15_07740 [Methanoculleus taiwanensis]|uniref:Connectase MJ0548-like N-terminal domain-containing protein n=1 Tax=Methanoculleus taiwanensis TaxID=1550565 RepID=A0A498GZJ2_9EURY|nr:DUF2121 domain-containing protein [Methanoculleus taiwanensis]RXE56069.1 hypothetical protein ABH15_07740 [Methanoculleus taiwanensis]
MSLVIAFIGARGAVMAGDMREILFSGDDSCRDRLEAELYDGRIVTDEALARRAQEIGIGVYVRDTKNKVAERSGILVGEVGETEKGVVRSRRLYASAGRYAIADFEDGCMTVVSQGTGSTFIVLGNAIAKQVTNRCIRDTWKGGTPRDAVRTIVLAMETAARTTASVSERYVLVQTPASRDLRPLLDEDARRGEERSNSAE